MFQVIQNLALEEEEEFCEDYFSSQDLEADQYEELPDPTQFVEVSNPDFIETMLSNDAAPLEALLDFQEELSNINLINTESVIKQDLSFSTPIKKHSPIEPSTPITFNEMIFGESPIAFDTPSMEKKENPVETPLRKTIGGKTIVMYHHYAVDENQRDEEIDIMGIEEEDEEVPIVISSTKKRKNSKTPKFDDIKASKTTKKSKTKLTKSRKANQNEQPVSVVYNILTRLDTPPLKAKHLEKSISRVFMGEELVKMQKNCEEDDIVDII